MTEFEDIIKQSSDDQLLLVIMFASEELALRKKLIKGLMRQ